MYHEPDNILVSAAPTRRLPATAAEAVAMYAIRKVETTEELINLAQLIRDELAKINGYLDEAIGRMEAKKQAEEEELGKIG